MSTWGVRKVTIAGMAVALVGQVLFSLAPAVLYLHIGRVLVGVGVAASFLGFVTVTKNWFRPEEAATMMGLSIAVGVLGATLGQVSEKPRRTPSQVCRPHPAPGREHRACLSGSKVAGTPRRCRAFGLD